jgi:radical SAM superfamily enzyme YgiQ (UPF0313 family)
MQVLRAVLVAPSRYDERGLLVFRIGINQNGSLGALAGMIEDYNRRHAGRAGIRYEIFDEHVRRAATPALIRSWRDAAAAAGERFVLLVCGVQTATWPRGRDVALMARSEGVAVVAGGVHLSSHGPSLEFLVSCGVSVGIGEVEPLFDRIADDALAGRLAPVYRIGEAEGVRVKTAVSEISAPALEQLPFPHMPKRHLARYLNPSHLYIDSSRGCPYVCSFCTVKNTFGRTVRSRDPGEVVRWMAERVDRDGIRWFTFTDDNFIRNPRHLEILEGVAKIRAEGRRFSVGLILDVESSCYAGEQSARGERTRRFLALCREAGVSNVFMGLESTNDASLREMAKNVNRDRKAADADAHGAILERYRAAVRGWHEIGASVECGYILGFDADGPGCGAQAAGDMMAIGIDIVSFYLLTPLPGAEDYAREEPGDARRARLQRVLPQPYDGGAPAHDAARDRGGALHRGPPLLLGGQRRAAARARAPRRGTAARHVAVDLRQAPARLQGDDPGRHVHLLRGRPRAPPPPRRAARGRRRRGGAPPLARRGGARTRRAAGRHPRRRSHGVAADLAPARLRGERRRAVADGLRSPAAPCSSAGSRAGRLAIACASASGRARTRASPRCASWRCTRRPPAGTGSGSPTTSCPRAATSRVPRSSAGARSPASRRACRA